MTTQIGASVFVDPTEIRHEILNGNPTLTFGPYPTVRRLDLHLGDRETIHAVIAHLVALEQEMAPPVIADDEPAPKCETCGATDDLEKTLWLSMADHSERARYFCNDRRACNDRRFPEMAALLASGPCASTSPESGFRCSETGEHAMHRSRAGMITWPAAPVPSAAQDPAPAAELAEVTA